MEILVTNDDGVHAQGLLALRHALEPLGKIWVVAPEREQSGASHALTLHRPLRVRRLENNVFAVDGTPTDCVLLACRGMPEMLDAQIGLVVSGINHGPNLSEDVTYSGTVAAAIEGLMLGRPSLALSMEAGEKESFGAAASVARFLVEKILEQGMPPGALLNVNVPGRAAGEIQGYRITKLGKRHYAGQVFRNTDPRGRPYYWIGEEETVYEPQDGADFQAVREGYVSVTPIHLDLTDHPSIDVLRRWNLPDGGLAG